MHGKVHRGLDYTPLFRFLLSKVGKPWDDVHAEAVARLDKPDPIFWLVALPGQDRNDYVRVGESSYYSGLYIDDAGGLQLVDASLGPASLTPSCACCTHTFNGVRFTQRFGDVAHVADAALRRRMSRVGGVVTGVPMAIHRDRR